MPDDESDIIDQSFQEQAETDEKRLIWFDDFGEC